MNWPQVIDDGIATVFLLGVLAFLAWIVWFMGGDR